MDALLMKALTELIEKGKAVALVTVTNKQGSGPRDSGSMMLVDEMGHLLLGTIGGGKVEEQAKSDAAVCLKEGRSSAFHYELTLSKSEHSLGMACGGVVDVFIKAFPSRDELIVFGGGHIALDLVKFAGTLNYKITVIDHRSEFYSEERFPGVDRRLSMTDFLESPFEIGPRSSVVLITHGHAYDMEALKAVSDSQAAYIGMIGSKTKINHCFKELEAQGVSRNLLDRVYAPIGLDIGGEAPAEIALAIMSEIQAVKYGRPGGFLSSKRREPLES